MKINIYTSILFSLLVFFLSACSNDFLHENKNLTIQEYLPVLHIDKGESTGTMKLHFDDLNSIYTIKEFPRWIEADSYNGNITNGVLNLTYTINKTYIKKTIEESHILLEIKNRGLIMVNIALLDFNAQLETFPSNIKFKKNETSYNISIWNSNSDNPLVWQIAYIPDWMSASIYEGIIEEGTDQIQRITFSYDINRYESIEDNDSIVIISNNKLQPRTVIQVKAGDNHQDNDIYPPIVGRVRDSEYSKLTNKLYVLTEWPNTLLEYDINSNKWETFLLPKIPNCMTLSENGKQAFVGGMNFIAVINLDTKTITKTIDTDREVVDIVYGENNWCYFTVPNTFYDHFGFLSINLSDHKIYMPSSFSGDSYYINKLSKIKNKPLLIENISSTRGEIRLVDISDGYGDIIAYYFERNLGLGDTFFLSEDLGVMICNQGYISKIPDEVTYAGDIEAVDRFHERISWADFGKNYIYAVSTYIEGDDINIYDKKTYQKIYSSATCDYYGDVDGITGYHQTTPIFVFANEDDSAFYIVKKVRHPYRTNWSLEIKTLN